MSDEDLRALERAVATGEPGARVRLGAELERLGRRDDAIAALLPGADDLAVRRALGALPCWSKNGHDAASRYLDAPELAWLTHVPEDGVESQVLASPLGLALGPGLVLASPGSGRGVREAATVVGLERATGEERWRRGPFPRLRSASTSLVRDVAYLRAAS